MKSEKLELGSRGEEMLMPVSCAVFTSLTPSYPPVNENGRKIRKIFAKKRDLQEKPTTHQKPLFPLSLSRSILSRTAIAVFGLGFIDAGYSGDWSRIGVITPQTEELLKIAAFAVVPLCVFLILSISKEPSS
ncbi:uncharacterized protein LOC129320844 [Prosopis cineraria]|uniref:uncharacterized protein LOC129320844 n=1 Tax=Prosopis cineraria TaxID=364024 RepID=UPI0024102713|nr:uncharacterized protein LOC129320844 [Prosopis cineraria]